MLAFAGVYEAGTDRWAVCRHQRGSELAGRQARQVTTRPRTGTRLINTPFCNNTALLPTSHLPTRPASCWHALTLSRISPLQHQHPSSGRTNASGLRATSNHRDLPYFCLFHHPVRQDSRLICSVPCLSCDFSRQC